MASEPVPPPTPRALEITQRLIAFNTTVDKPGGEIMQELECQQYVAGLLAGAGFQVDIWEPAVDELRDHPMYRDGQHWRQRPIVGAVLPGTGGGRSLLFNGHIDTVPAGDLSEWSSDPWVPEIRDRRLYGRGACDMKGGVAAMLDAALTLAEGPRPRGDLVVEVVTDEEVNGMGTIAAIRRGYRADAAIVPEPTGLDIYLAFRGILVGEVEVTGRQGHAEIVQPHWSRGGAVNAIHHMLPVLAWLRVLNDEWRGRPDKQHPLCSTGEVNVTTITGGDFQSNVPEKCRATINICYVPGEQDADGYGGRVIDEVERHFARVRTGWLEITPPQIRWLVDYPPVELAADAPVVQALSQALAAQVNRWPALRGLDTWDDTASLIHEAGIPAVSCGPGSNYQAHAVDEYVPVDELLDCARVLTEFARGWLNQPT
jgi:acetylornithine deacetylase